PAHPPGVADRRDNTGIPAEWRSPIRHPGGVLGAWTYESAFLEPRGSRLLLDVNFGHPTMMPVGREIERLAVRGDGGTVLVELRGVDRGRQDHRLLPAPARLARGDVDIGGRAARALGRE